MLHQMLKDAGRWTLLAAICLAAIIGFLAYRHRDDAPARSTLATGTPLEVYRMHCASAGTAPGEQPGPGRQSRPRRSVS